MTQNNFETGFNLRVVRKVLVMPKMLPNSYKKLSKKLLKGKPRSFFNCLNQVFPVLTFGLMLNFRRKLS